jgi:hypothetical protein
MSPTCLTVATSGSGARTVSGARERRRSLAGRDGRGADREVERTADGPGACPGPRAGGDQPQAAVSSTRRSRRRPRSPSESPSDVTAATI